MTAIVMPAKPETRRRLGPLRGGKHGPTGIAQTLSH